MTGFGRFARLVIRRAVVEDSAQSRGAVVVRLAAATGPRINRNHAGGQMAYTLQELRNKTVAQLREIADGVNHESLKGRSTMHKDHLIVALCAALGIDTKEHHEVVGINKAAIKSTIKQLKDKRDQALAGHDHAQLRAVRRRIHRLKRKMHKATV
jgi:hypothetical protein